jgi:uncharacterized protein YjbJ (UPF0337 family)
MNQDRIVGTARNVGGKVEETIGRVTGDAATRLEGKAKQVEGAVQDFYGQAKDKAVDAAETVRDSIGEADDVVRDTIAQHPYASAAVALGIGFLIGRMARH